MLGIGSQVGYEEFITNKGLKSGAASMDLANPAHIDPNDMSRSYAVWVLQDPRLPAPRMWWFLFPDVGLAIELSHGVVISWDGRAARHCTALQECDTRQHLYSLFYALPKIVGAECDHVTQMRAALSIRRQVAHACDTSFKLGDLVWVKWRPCKRKPKSWVRRRARITQICDGQTTLGWCSRHSISTYTSFTDIPDQILHDTVVHAGALDAAMYAHRPCLSMLGQHLRVYSAADDEVVEGVAVDMYLHIDSGNAYVDVMSQGSLVHIPIVDFMNPPLCASP